jgi:hypothetical protein
MKEINCDELLPTCPTCCLDCRPSWLKIIALSISISFQSIYFLNRSICPKLETNDENYAVGELHQSDQVMQY